MATIVRCNCGAEYRRTEEKFLVPHTGDAVCTVCGAALESWWKAPTFRFTNLLNVPIRSRNDQREKGKSTKLCCVGRHWLVGLSVRQFISGQCPLRVKLGATHP